MVTAKITLPIRNKILTASALLHLRRQIRENMENILTRWKQKQGEEKPLLVVVTTSGGGTRSATFTMDVLQYLDSITNGQIMKKTFLFTGASGGMIGATYFRELYREKQKNPKINLQSKEYVDNIAGDLLNPTFTSFIARDIFAPEQKFSVGSYTYLRDRGLAFESALDDNTDGVLNKRLEDYILDESSASMPLFFYHTLITRDGKIMLINTQHLRFMMRPPADSADGAPAAMQLISQFFKAGPIQSAVAYYTQDECNIPRGVAQCMAALTPKIDVMDGGLRDNYGVGTSFRFLSHMQRWIEQNTRGGGDTNSGQT